MIRFLQKSEQEAPQALLEMGLDERLARLLAMRGIDTEEAAKAFLSPSLAQLHDPMLMPDMAAAVALIRQVIADGGRIVIYGDYDVDGVTATAILLTYLRKQGAKADFYIPARHGEGYGLNIPAVEKIAGEAQLLITVDCGITSVAEVKRAGELGLAVIVTDHHQTGQELPPAAAILNPLLGGYPFGRLCGAGVALKLVQAMGGIEAVTPLLDLAALATIADIVPLLGENRVIVAEGLKLLREAKRPGLQALMQAAGVDPAKLSAGQVGFQLAPRINAGGRLSDAARGVELLTTRDAQAAQRIAQALDEENVARQRVEQHILEEAEAMLPAEVDFLTDRVILLCKAGWNAGVIGLVASRLVEKYRWPVLLLARDGDVCVGSARSIPGINIHAALYGCRELFLRFGGHAQAAGLTMQAASLPELKKRLSAAISAQAAPDTFLPTELYDLELTLAEVTEPLVMKLEQLQPTGFGNPAPVFCVRGASPVEPRAIGKDGAHLKMLLSQDGEVRDAVAFRMGARVGDLPERVDALFSPGINAWQDKRTVQCEVKQLAPHAAAKAFLAACAGRQRTFLRAISQEILYNYTVTPSETAVERVKALSTDALDMALRDAFAEGAQGTLLIVHTLPALRKWTVRLAVMGAPLTYQMGFSGDPRMFHTLCAAPDWHKLTRAPKRIVLLDGAYHPALLADLARRFPDTELLMDKDAGPLRAQAVAEALPTDEQLRDVYRALRDLPQATEAALAEKTGLSPELLCVALTVLDELKLLSFAPEPWQLKLLPSHKVELTDSVLLTTLRAQS